MWLEKSEYVGTWCTAAHDSDRAVRRDARASWDAVTRLGTGDEQDEGINLVEHADSIASFAFSVILGNGGAFPAAGGADTPLGETPSTPGEDPAFLRTAAITALAYLVQTLPSPLPLSAETIETLTGEDLWDLLTRSIAPGAREQPGMVRKALYDLLGAIVGRQGEELLLVSGDASCDATGDESADESGGNSRLREIAARVLGNCWDDEEGWPSIVLFLRSEFSLPVFLAGTGPGLRIDLLDPAGYPQAWSLADLALQGDEGDDEEVEEDEPAEQCQVDAFKPSPTVALLLRHLTLGCSGHPTSLYPTILLVLATLPASHLPPTPAALSLLFESFWAAYSSRAIAMGGARAVQAWASSLLEAVLYETSRIDESHVAASIACEWIGNRLFALTLGRGDDAKVPTAARLLAAGFEKSLARLAGREHSAAFEACWGAIAGEAMAAVSAAASLAPEAQAALTSLATALQSLAASADETIRTRGRQLAFQCLRLAVTGVAQAGEDQRCDELLAFILDISGSVDEVESQTVGPRTLTSDLDPSVITDLNSCPASQILDELARTRLPGLIADSPTALQLFVSCLAVPSDSRDALWRELFAPVPPPDVLLRLLDAVTESGLAGDLPTAGLDEHVTRLAGKVFGADADYTHDELELLRRIVLQPQPLVTPSVAHDLVSLSAQALGDTVGGLHHAPSGPSLERLVAPTALIAHFVQLSENARAAFAVPGLAMALFDVGHALPGLGDAYLPGEAVAAAQQGWAGIVAATGDEAVALVLGQLRERVVDEASAASTIEVVSMATDLLESYPSTRYSLQDVLPSQDDLGSMHARVSIPLPAPSLAIIDPLIPVIEPSSIPANSTHDFDHSFLSSYGRSLVALLEVSARDHTVLRRHASWVLPHLLFLADVARDELCKPSSSGQSSGVFAPDVPAEILDRVSAAADGAASYLLSTLANALPNGWHASAVTHLRAKELAAPPPDDALLGALDSMWREARGSGSKALYAQRGVRTLLSAMLRYAEDGGGQDAERWLALAQTTSSSGALFAFDQS